MDQHKLQIVLDAKNQTQGAFLSAQGGLKTFQDRTQGAFLKAGGYVKSFTDKIFSMQGVLAGVAGAAGLGLFIDKSLKAADAIGKTADRIGISTGALQEYRYAAGLAGVDTGKLDKGIEKFTKNLGEARSNTGTLVTFLKKYDETLLQNVKSANSTDEALQLVFEAMGNAGTAADKAALANAAFGRSGIEMTNIVKDGANGLNAMRTEARELGIVMDEQMIRNAEKANDEMSKLVQVIKLQFMSAAVGLAPEIAKIAESTTDWWRANQQFVKIRAHETIEDIKDAVVGIKSIYDAMPDGIVGAAGAGIVGRLIFGGLGPAKVVSALYLLNEQMSKLSWMKDFSVQAQIDYGKEFNEAFWNIYDAATGRKDWSTGVQIGGGEKFFPIPKDATDTGFNMGYYAAELNKYQDGLAKTTDKATKDIARKWQTNFYDPNQDAYRQMTADYQKYVDSLGSGRKDDAKLTAEKARAEIELKNMLIGSLKRSDAGYFKLRWDQLEADKQKYRDLGMDEGLVSQAFFNREKNLLRERKLAYGNFFEGIAVGLDTTRDDFISWADAGLATFEEFTQGAAAAAGDTLFGYLTGEIEDFGDLWDSVWKNALHTFTDILGQMATRWALSGVADFLGINIGGGGGGGISSLLGLGTSVGGGGSGGGGGGGSPFTGGGLIGKLSSLFGGGGAGGETVGGFAGPAADEFFSGLTAGGSSVFGGGGSALGGISTFGEADVAGLAAAEAAQGGGSAAAGVSGAGALGIIGAGILAAPLFGRSVTSTIHGWFSKKTAPSAYEYLDAYFKGVPAGTPLFGGYPMPPDSWFEDDTNMASMLSNIDQNVKIKRGSPLVDLAQNKEITLQDITTWIATGKYGTWTDPTAHASGGVIDRVIRPPGVRIPAGDDGLVSAQIGEEILTREESMLRRSGGGGRIVIEVPVMLNGREIARSVAEYGPQSRAYIAMFQRMNR